MIPLYDFRPSPSDEEAVLAALRAGHWADGPSTRALEQDFARLVGVPHAVATASGTGALEAVCAACLQPGDEILTTPFTFIATVNALRSVGAVPRFADVDPATGNLAPEVAVEALRVYPRVKGLMLVHLYGCPCDMAPFLSLARQRDLIVLEDCAQAAGATHEGKAVGAFGLASAFSFYATKNLAAGEGGMVCTANPDVAATVRRFINHGRGGMAYRHETPGHNLRMHGLAVALARSRLERLEQENRVRRAHAAAYREALGDLDWLALPPDTPGHVYHQFVVRTPWRDELREHLAAAGVESAVYYPEVVYRQPAYAGWEALPCPIAEQLTREVLSLPIRPSLTPLELEAVVTAVRSFSPGAPPERGGLTWSG